MHETGGFVLGKKNPISAVNLLWGNTYVSLWGAGRGLKKVGTGVGKGIKAVAWTAPKAVVWDAPKAVMKGVFIEAPKALKRNWKAACLGAVIGTLALPGLGTAIGAAMGAAKGRPGAAAAASSP